jgi:hypothetical protein
MVSGIGQAMAAYGNGSAVWARAKDGTATMTSKRILKVHRNKLREIRIQPLPFVPSPQAERGSASQEAKVEVGFKDLNPLRLKNGQILIF